jgi:hypothetical protein
MSGRELRDFKKAALQEYVFPGTDAAVVFVPDGARPPREVQEVLDRSHQQRWFPVDGGSRAKVPFYHTEGREHLFEREAKGWDHEHCDFCNAHIRIGELCWTAPSNGGILIFCKDCYEKVPT